MEETTYSVVQLNSMVGEAVRRAQPDELWVKGEVQNLRTRNGHTYFKLVEKAGQGERIQGRLDVALFKDDAPKIRRALAEVPGAALGDDVEVRIKGRVRIYPPTGQYQLVMTGIDPVFTVGGSRPTATACSAPSRPRGSSAPTPDSSCRRCRCASGLITSQGSAAYHDFVDELLRSPYAWRVGVVDVAVQGAGAAQRIKWALGQLAQRRRRRGGHRPGRRVACRSGAVRHRARGAGDRRDGRARDHRCRARDRPQRRRRGRALRVQDAHRVRAAARAAGSTSSWVCSTSRRSGWRHARQRMAVAARELDEAARRARRSATEAVVREQHPTRPSHGRLDELARRRTVDLTARLDGAPRGERAGTTSDARPSRRARHARAELVTQRSTTSSARAAARRAVTASCARSTRAACWSAAIRSPATPTAASCARLTRSSRARCSTPSSRPDGSPAGSRRSARRRTTCRREPVTDEIGYADAMRELDDILEELERDDLDVDVLAVRVQRAERAHPALPRPHRPRPGRRRPRRHRPRSCARVADHRWRWRNRRSAGSPRQKRSIGGGQPSGR